MPEEKRGVPQEIEEPWEVPQVIPECLESFLQYSLPAPVVTQFGVRGDSLMQTRHDGAKTKKYRTMKAEFEIELYNVFGECGVDYELNPGENLREVVRSIANGPSFSILCVGIAIQDLLDPTTYAPVPSYPLNLDQELTRLAAAILSKANGSMVWVGGPAEFWGRQRVWDTYMAHARNTLRNAGLQVVPVETVDFVMRQLTLSTDEFHIANVDAEKEVFAKAWATCLYAAAADPTWGRAITGEIEEVSAAAATWTVPEVSAAAASWTSPPVAVASEPEADLKVNRGRRPERSRSRQRPAEQPKPIFSYGRGSESKSYGVTCSMAADPRKPWYERAAQAEKKEQKQYKSEWHRQMDLINSDQGQ